MLRYLCLAKNANTLNNITLTSYHVRQMHIGYHIPGKKNLMLRHMMGMF